MTGRHSVDRQVPHPKSAVQPTLRLLVHRPARHRVCPQGIAAKLVLSEDTQRRIEVLRGRS